jgi:membrane fusion protein (multidrug efflux system)
MKVSNILGLACSIILFASCSEAAKDTKSKQKPPAKVDVMIAENMEFPKSIEVNGTVLSNEMVELHPEVSGRLIFLNIPDGTKVQQGTILARINDADLQAQLEQQKAQLNLAKKNEQRLQTLLQINGVNQADYDAAANQVTSLQANVKVVIAQIEKTVIRAPFSGTLGLRLVSPGAYVTPQTLIGTLQQIDKIKIDFSVPETYASLVKVGNSITIQTNESNQKLTAKISAIEPQINTSTRNIKVRAILENGLINPGTYVKVQLNQKGNGIVIPTNAIIPDAFANQVVVIKNGKAEFKNVETGVRTPDIIELVSGVEIGDSIVVSGILNVRANEKVVIKKVKTLRELK